MGTESVRGFLFQKIPTNAKLSPRAVGMALAEYVDRWRAVGGKKLACGFARSTKPTHTASIRHPCKLAVFMFAAAPGVKGGFGGLGGPSTALLPPEQ